MLIKAFESDQNEQTVEIHMYVCVQKMADWMYFKINYLKIFYT